MKLILSLIACLGIVAGALAIWLVVYTTAPSRFIEALLALLMASVFIGTAAVGEAVRRQTKVVES